jgi:CRP-like cAMP-binding protein
LRLSDWIAYNEQSLPGELLNRLWSDAHVVRARAGQIVIAHGVLSKEVYFVLSGAFEVLITARDGRDVVVRDLGSGALFGDFAALDGEPRSATVVATIDSSIARIPSDTFLNAVAEIPEASRWFMHRLSNEVRRLTDKIFELSVIDARGRLHCELLRSVVGAPRSGAYVKLDPAPTHEALAQRIGSQREAVSRELARLEIAGILNRTRRRIEVDVSRLARLVETEIGHLPPLSRW